MVKKGRAFTEVDFAGGGGSVGSFPILELSMNCLCLLRV